MIPDDRTLEALANSSREFRLACSADGAIRWVDDRVARLFDAARGDDLRDRIAPGCAAKLEDFLSRGRREPVTSCELPFVVRGKVETVTVSSVPYGDGLLAICHVIPEAFAAAVSQVNEMLAEISDLNRSITLQRNEIARRNTELVRMNAELSESNQGILSLHRELQERADVTRQEGEIKSRLVSSLSHELRTPLHSILGLTGLLLGGSDGGLAAEQEKQVRFIKSSADDLLALVNDVLDLGRLDAGQTHVHIDTFSLDELVAATRGVLRPLVTPGGAVELAIDDAPPGVMLQTDRTKLAQITRNLVSNALKFTEQGEVRVGFELEDTRLVVTVSDTGIGIAEADFQKIFEEYGQIDSALQRRLKGSGLGLPLSKRLAERLGGSLTVRSEVGVGSTFQFEVPLVHDEALAMNTLVERSRSKPPNATSILLVEDDRHTMFIYEKYLVMAGFHVMPARSIDEAMALMKEHRPAAIVLDIMLQGDSSWSFLARIKSDPETQDIPVLVVTVTDREAKARALGADEFWLKPVDQDRLLRKLKEISRSAPLARVLVIDDDDTARYIVRQHLAGTSYTIYEAATGDDGVRIAREQHPHVILLDFLLKGCTAFDVIDDLKADPRTRGIPIIVITSHVLDALDQKRLLQEAEAVISKQNLSRELAINRIRDALRKIGRESSR